MKKGGHAVLCIGYDKKENAWICKNSWGSSWGMNGYFKIGMGECGIDANMYAVSTLDIIYPIYMDVMLRDTFKDFGQSSVSGNVCCSPDIIPRGMEPIVNPDKELVNKWFDDIGKKLTLQANNMIYMRGISHSQQKTKAKFYLYYSKASLLMYPEQWENNLIPCSNGSDFFETDFLEQGDLAVTIPFTWKPKSIESSDHYCLVGRIVTDAHPNPIPRPTDVREFAKFIAQNPNYSMRNITVVKKDIPDYSVALAYEQGSLGTEMHFIVESKGCSPDAEFSLTSTNMTTTVPISIARQKVPPDGVLTGIHVDVPKDFKTQLYLNFWNNHPRKATNDWELNIKVFYIVNNELDGLINIASLQYGDMEPKRAVLLGAYTIKAESGK